MLNCNGESNEIICDDPSGVKMTSIMCDPTDKPVYMNPDAPVTHIVCALKVTVVFWIAYTLTCYQYKIELFLSSFENASLRLWWLIFVCTHWFSAWFFWQGNMWVCLLLAIMFLWYLRTCSFIYINQCIYMSNVWKVPFRNIGHVYKIYSPVILSAYALYTTSSTSKVSIDHGI